MYSTTIIKYILIAICICIVIIAAVFCVYVLEISKEPEAEPIEVSVFSDLDIPDKRIIAVGTPTHGNAEPFNLSLEILKRVYEEQGSVAFILEEVAGDAETINNQHSYTKEDGDKLGMYAIYENNEMSSILDWLSKTNQRIYGIDIQSISETANILSRQLDKLHFPEAVKVLQLPTSSAQEIEKNGPFLDSIQKYIKEQESASKISEQDCTYLLHLLDCIRMNYEYIISGYSFGVRDKLMAENVEWIMDFEEKYFNNSHAVLLASNGHAIKSGWSYRFSGEYYVPMGSHLSEKYKQDYFLILTDAYENHFEAYATGLNTSYRQTFRAYNKQLYTFFDGMENRIHILDCGTDTDGGNQNITLVIIGSMFSIFRSLSDKYYTAQIALNESCDLMVCYELMTPVERTA